MLKKMKPKMKGKDDADADDTAAVTPTSAPSTSNKGSVPEASSTASFIQQEQLCKELYLSMGVHPTDIADTSDDDVASILEQMNKLHPNPQESGASGDRNIEDILQEAESLLDGQNAHPYFKPKCYSRSSRSVSSASCLSHRSAPFKSTDEDDHQYIGSARSTSQQRLLNITETIESSILGLGKEINQTANDNLNSQPPDHSSKSIKQLEGILPPNIVGTPLEVTYKRIYEQIRKEVDGSLKPHLSGDFPDLKLSLPVPGLDTPSFEIPGCFNLEHEFLEERKRCLKLKADLDWLRRQHEREVAELRKHHEGQLNQVREELSSTTNHDESVYALQKEIKSQERIISGYQEENEKICAELKDIKRQLLKLMALLKADNDNVCIVP
ncbi:Centrosomal protein of 162 kDa [Frankliniella fusca]|uniref:Centrosomal protein of 162 kDa n=1 Tax=Frankliniella fusca TaxID=407009 RepID=A0AAE1LQH7_9NEOP|nr:Centrosomal protein of 162 kDa [Frankliniella fusca]